MSQSQPKLVGIVNITEDSFSDGGAYFDPRVAMEHACRLIEDGADMVELGPASSHPDSQSVSADEERRRLEPVLDELLTRGVSVGVDSCLAQTQLYCLERGVSLLNDIKGFPDPALYADLAASSCRLVIMHSLAQGEKATRQATDPAQVYEGLVRFLNDRVTALRSAGVEESRMILDPGMGFFLGSNPEPSFHVLANLRRLRECLGLPLMVSVSRKSFLGAATNRPVGERGAATQAAELYAAAQGVDYIRTHDVGSLKDGLRVIDAVNSQA